MIDLKVFDGLSPNVEKLVAYGFSEKNDEYIYSKEICNDFYAIFSITENSVKVDVIEKDTEDKLQLFYLPEVTGSFIGEINAACEKLANDIIANCFSLPALHGRLAHLVIEYIKQKYDDTLENLWKKFPEDGIWRRADNKKWYALLMVVEKSKIDGVSNKKIDVLDLRVDKTAPSIVDNKQIFPGYHMNKKSWITVCLDGSMPIEKIYELIDKSYILAKEK